MFATMSGLVDALELEVKAAWRDGVMIVYIAVLMDALMAALMTTWMDGLTSCWMAAVLAKRWLP